MVYIDSFNATFGRMTMCHMVADTSEELIQMAEKIGVHKRWIQSKGTPYEHFDICLSKKKLAIQFGAKVVTLREMGEITALKQANGSNTAR